MTTVITALGDPIFGFLIAVTGEEGDWMVRNQGGRIALVKFAEVRLVYIE